mmetsp:Transcript_1714/g.4088  ORF Transcript_1714/g.4088 Transcript_1714/m.4088 type:complete len:262 (-) Transcript_1714:933-1718(-)
MKVHEPTDGHRPRLRQLGEHVLVGAEGRLELVVGDAVGQLLDGLHLRSRPHHRQRGGPHQRSPTPGRQNSTVDSTDIPLPEGIREVRGQDGKKPAVVRHQHHGSTSEQVHSHGGVALSCHGDHHSGDRRQERDPKPEQSIGSLPANPIRPHSPAQPPSRIRARQRGHVVRCESRGHHGRGHGGEHLGTQGLGRRENGHPAACVAKHGNPQQVELGFRHGFLIRETGLLGDPVGGNCCPHVAGWGHPHQGSSRPHQAGVDRR